MNVPTTCALLLGATALAYIAVCGAIAWRVTTARRRTPLVPAGVEVVRLMSRAMPHIGSRVTWLQAAYLQAPGARGAVVLVHGKDACRGDELGRFSFSLAQRLVECRFSVLMLDLGGHGGSCAARLTYGARERFDVLGAVDWLRERGYMRIGVFGASLGAASSLLAAADEPAIAALVADSAFADFGPMIRRQYRRLSRLPACFLPGALLLGRLLTGVDIRRVSPLAAARALAGRPLLVIHSRGDRLVPPEDAIAIARDAAAELWITNSAGHIGSYGAAPEDYEMRVAAFFCWHLQGRG